MKNKSTFVLALVGVLLAFADTAMANPFPPLPDAGSSAVLLGLSLTGIAVARVYFSKKK